MKIHELVESGQVNIQKLQELIDEKDKLETDMQELKHSFAYNYNMHTYSYTAGVGLFGFSEKFIYTKEEFVDGVNNNLIEENKALKSKLSNFKKLKDSKLFALLFNKEYSLIKNH